MMKETVQERLQRHHIKPSVQRMAVLGYLMENHIHPTADMIFNALYPTIPTLSKATVYNTLNLLTEREVIKMITIDEKNARFDANDTPHLHFKCSSCGEIYDIEFSPTSILPLQGYQVNDIQVYCKGICPHCQKENNIN